MQCHSRLNEAIKLMSEKFGISSPRGGQVQAVNSILCGQDILGLFPTGYGKSLIYRVLSLMFDGITLVVSPLISLMQDQTDFASRIDPRLATFINSTLTPEERRKRLWSAVRGSYRMVYIAPERLRMRDFQAALKQMSLSLLTIDEAHCIVMWGYDFRPEYLRLQELRRMAKHTLALTATATPQMSHEIIELLGGSMKLLRAFSLIRPNIRLNVIVARDLRDKFLYLKELLANRRGQTIVYTATRQDAELVSDFAGSIGLKASAYHAALSNSVRNERQNAFMRNELDVLAATNAFGMGIDKPDIRHIIHWSIPESIESYYQEVGRAGRDGLSADATLLFSMEDVELRKFMISKSIAEPENVIRIFELAADWRRKSKWSEIYIPPDEFMSELDIDETELNVALSLLEQLNLLRRLPDLTEELLVEDSHHKFVVRPLDSMGAMPSELEDALWDSHFKQNLNIRKAGETRMTLKILAEPDSKTWVRIHRLIESMRRRKLDAFNFMLNEFIATDGCREKAIAVYLGEEHPGRCGQCDKCVKKDVPHEIRTFMRAKLLDLADGAKLEAWVVGELLTNGLIRLNDNDIAITDRGKNFLEDERSVKLCANFELEFRGSSNLFWKLTASNGFLASQIHKNLMRKLWLRAWRPISKSDEFIENFLNEPHPIHFGGENYEGLALDYLYKPERTGFGEQFRKLKALEAGRGRWNYDLIARSLIESIVEEGWHVKFGAWYSDRIDKKIMERIADRVFNSLEIKRLGSVNYKVKNVLVITDVFNQKRFRKWLKAQKLPLKTKIYIAAVAYRSH